MRKRLFRSTAVGLLALALVLPGGARPANAIPPAVIGAIASVAGASFTIIRGLTSGGLSIEDATRQIIAAVDTAKTEIITQIDLLATAPAKACATRAVIEFADIERFNPDVLQQWAQDATGCLTLIDSLIATVSTPASIDQLGLVLDVVGPIAIAARARAGFSTTTLQPVLLVANTNIVNRLAPTCRFFDQREPGTPVVERYTICTAYNGDTAEAYQSSYRGGPFRPAVDVTALGNEATRNTSRTIALRVLPLL